MAARFEQVDRDTPMLLPPDLRQWVAKDDLVHFLLAAIETCDCSQARINYRGSGSAQYPPSMMAALVIYCYAHGIFSSRDIERATHWHIAVRYICGNEHHPDHDTIAKFRRENEALIKSCFLRVLAMAKDLKACKQFGTVSVDGTKIAARASKGSNRKLSDLQCELADLEKKIEQIMGQAKVAEAASSEQDSLCKQLQDKQARKTALQEAKRRLEARIARRNEDEPPREGPPSATSCDPGPSSQPEPPVEAAKTANKKERRRREKHSINLAEPESRLMKNAQGQYVQAYNVQAVVDAGGSQLILGVRLSQDGNDRRALEGTLQSVDQATCKEMNHVLVDTGYDNADMIATVESQRSVTVLCPPQSKGAEKAGKSYRANRKHKHRIDLAQRMRERFDQPELKELYKRRSATIEPVFGVLKNVLGFRRFRLFGIAKAQIELFWAATAYNIRKLHQISAQIR